jgi:uncharacterized OB-fold protein
MPVARSCWRPELAAVGRPSPSLSEPDTGPFWVAAQEHRLTYQVCAACGEVIFYPRGHCPHCGAGSPEWRDSAGLGTIYSYTTIRQTPDPAFRAEVPYTVAYVDLTEGFRMLTRLAADPAELTVGAAVTVVWRRIDGVEFPTFGLLPAAGPR